MSAGRVGGVPSLLRSLSLAYRTGSSPAAVPTGCTCSLSQSLSQLLSTSATPGCKTTGGQWNPGIGVPNQLPLVSSQQHRAFSVSASVWAAAQAASAAASAPSQAKQAGRALPQPGSNAPNTRPILIQPSAVQRLKALQAARPGQPISLRIEVEGGGCSGYQYKFSIDTHAPGDADMVFEAEGARVVCDAVSYTLLRGASIEFEDSLMRSAFVVGENPNSEASCGCGSSFTAKPIAPRRSKLQ